MRDGAQYFRAELAQRRYEALRAYFGRDVRRRGRRGWSQQHHRWPACCAGSAHCSRTAAKARKATGGSQRVLELRAAGIPYRDRRRVHSEGLPVSAQTCWQILDAEGLPRLPAATTAAAAAPDPVRPPRCPAGRTRGRPAVRSRRAAAPAAA